VGSGAPVRPRTASIHAQGAHRQLAPGCRLQPVVERPGFVGLPVAEAHVAQVLDRNDLRQGLGYVWEEPLEPGVEEQGVVLFEEELG
jgi:hypothetical protein